MAGSEKQGYAHSRAKMFDGAPLILTPTEKTNETALEWSHFIAKAFGCCGMPTLCARRHMMKPSPLWPPSPYRGARAVRAASGNERFAGGSFSAVTRVAQLNAPLWAGLLADNAEYVLKSLSSFRQSLMAIEAAISTGDATALEALLLRLSKEDHKK